MKKYLSAPIFKNKTQKFQNITKFCGYDRTKIQDGMLIDSENVTVLSGGALTSLLAEKKVDMSRHPLSSLEGVYTFCPYCDSSYESAVSAEYVNKYICPDSVLEYEDPENESSRLIIKDTGKSPRTEEGYYRDVRNAFFDGENIYVFYAAEYNILDQRRSMKLIEYDESAVVQFDSGDDGEYEGKINIYQLTQFFLDVIRSNGTISSVLLEGRLDHIEEITETKYQHSTLITEDFSTYKYASADYTPVLEKNYTAYYDNVYADYYPILGDYDAKISYDFGEMYFVTYNNVTDAGTEYGSKGKKMMLLPDMKLINVKNAGVEISQEKTKDIPTMMSAVQQFDRLYGICNDRLYVSARGNCTDFSYAEDNEPSSGAWQTVTADSGGFTAIAAFDGRVAVFTKKSMLTVKGTELPFTLSHEADCGCYSQSAVTVCGGKLYFASLNGVMCYSGSTLSCISNCLPSGIDYSAVRIAEVSGMIVMTCGFSERPWVYMPSSGQWSRLSLLGDSYFLTSNGLIVQGNEGYKVYRLFYQSGSFSFDLMLKNIGRRRIKSITPTVKLGWSSRLFLYNSDGSLVADISGHKKTISKKIFLTGSYFDHGILHFEGSGDVTLLELYIEYEKSDAVFK